MIEKYVQLFHHLYGLGYVILRPGNIYGERHGIDRPQGAVGVFMSRMLFLPKKWVGQQKSQP